MKPTTIETLLADQVQRINLCNNPSNDVLDFIDEINNEEQTHIDRCYTFKDAKKLCEENECSDNFQKW